VLNLTGTNAYSGNTTVSKGTLQILVASINTNATVSVTAGAVLQLNFTTTNRVASFVTNGVALPFGIYKSNNVAPFIAGSGSLQVGTSPAPTPTIGSVTVSGGNLQVSVSTVAGYSYVLQTATNLNSPIFWTSISTNAGTGSNLPFSIPTGSALQKFVRFRVY
jgi:autotransporter-associated beta strand protein